MAQNQTAKRQDIASNLVAGRNQILTGLRLMEQAAYDYQKAGLTFTQADFDGTNLQHLTPALAENGMGAAAALRAWLESSFQITNLELL